MRTGRCYRCGLPGLGGSGTSLCDECHYDEFRDDPKKEPEGLAEFIEMSRTQDLLNLVKKTHP